MTTKTPAMVLQELTVKKGLPPPEYNLVHSKTGTHDNEFYYVVRVAHLGAKGFGRSKQVAKHDAASNALLLLSEKGLYDPTTQPMHVFNAQSHRNETGSPLKATINFVGTLKDRCVECKLPYPEFLEISDVGPPHCRLFTYECKMGPITTQSTANTKKQAKQLAAKDMLEKLDTTCPELADLCTSTDTNAITANDRTVLSRYNELADSLGVLPNRACTARDFTNCWRNLMEIKRVTFEDFREQVRSGTKDDLDYICKTLEVEYRIDDMHGATFVIFGLDTPFTVLTTGNELQLYQKVFAALEVYMTD